MISSNLRRIMISPGSTSADVQPLCRSSIRGHSEIMLGVLVVVLGRDPITCLEFSLGQSHVPIIASSRVVRTLRLSARSSRWRPLWAASKWPLLMPIHVSFPAMVHGLPPYGNERSKLRSKGCRPVIRPRSSSMNNACLLEDKTRLQCTELVVRREESGVTCQVPASPLPR